MQNQSNIINNANKSLGLDEIIKMLLFRELMRSMKQKNEFEARNSKYYKPLKKTYKKSSKCSSCFPSSYPGKTFDKNSKNSSCE
jgi:lipid II:glycine glycyltransferase (peptidoglycan interpeptide bridge formation enzyme)